MSKKNPALLCILDGLGLNPDTKGNAFALAKTPVLDNLLALCPHTTLTTHGEAVGLPEGQMGNSEVGHLNIGSGRVVEQWLLMISNALKSDFLDKSSSYQNFIKSDVHLIGLVSDGGVHSHINHLKLLLDKLEGIANNIYLHIITDGRDVSPKRSLEQVQELEKRNITIASVSGRYFAMDRDKRWDRTEKAYQAIVMANAPQHNSASDYIAACYEKGITDEFIEPAVIHKSPVKENDSILFWNFRADRMRQIVSAICLKNFIAFKRAHYLPDRNHVLCFTAYEDDFNLPYLFSQIEITNSLGEIVSKAGLRQIRIAETEKYPHVTYFFNGLSDQTFKNEERKLIPSPRDVPTYDKKPEMSAIEVKDTCLDAIKSSDYDLIVLNFANCDMVGHTGVLEAAIKAVETVDTCLGEILEVLKEKNGQALIIADHGNAEQMIKSDGSPHTAHTIFPVPAILFNSEYTLQNNPDAALCDVAPTILKMMGLQIPEGMSGKVLIQPVN